MRRRCRREHLIDNAVKSLASDIAERTALLDVSRGAEEAFWPLRNGGHFMNPSIQLS
jgi:hypothetical protein